MQTLDLDGLPEPVIRSLEQLVDALRERFSPREPAPGECELPSWPGRVLGGLSREEIYGDGG